MAAHLRRTCICCRAEASKGELLRFVRQGGRVQFDSSQRMSGRGAYVHATLSCWRKMGDVRRWKAAFSKVRGRAAAEETVMLDKSELERLMEETRRIVAGDPDAAQGNPQRGGRKMV